MLSRGLHLMMEKPLTSTKLEAERLLETRPDLPVVVITAFGSMETAVAALRAGAYDFVTKPIDMELLAIALELARENRNYEDIASKFFEHFLYIADAINHLGGDEDGLWNEPDGFFYDIIHTPDGRFLSLKIRSMVGIIPLFAVQTLEEEDLERLPGFRRRMEWFIANRPDLSCNMASLDRCGQRSVRRFSSGTSSSVAVCDRCRART